MSKALDVWSDKFPSLCATFGIDLREWTAAEAEISEACAAQYIVSLWRSSRWLRWRFPRALRAGGDSAFARWLQNAGARRLGLSAIALKKVRGAFRRAPGARIYDIYLQDRELQRLYPLGLTPAGQRDFLAWLTTHGRADQRVQDHEILWFLHQAADEVGAAVALSYAVNPRWQEQHPRALTPTGWPVFRQALTNESPPLCRWSRQLRCVPALEGVSPARAVSPGNGVNILSHFCYPSGIQQAAFWTKVALERAGFETSCRDVPAGIASKLLRRIDWLGLERFPVTIITVAPTPYSKTAYERAGLHRRRDVYRIAYWAWELENIPEEWVEMQSLFDEIWSPTDFVAAAMRTRMTVPVRTMPPGVEVGAIEKVERAEVGIAPDDYVFLVTFDMYSDVERKNPLGVIRAFREAFADDERAKLVLKTGSGAPDPVALEELRAAAARAGVVLITETVSRARAYGFIEMCDCYVSLHRSEGFGLGMAEAMLLSKPVIATGYSGNMSFMDDGNSFLVDYALEEIRRAGPLYRRGSRWASPSEAHAATLMRKAFDDRAAAAAVGARARREAEEKLSLDAAGARMGARLREIATARRLD